MTYLTTFLNENILRESTFKLVTVQSKLPEKEQQAGSLAGLAGTDCNQEKIFYRYTQVCSQTCVLMGSLVNNPLHICHGEVIMVFV